MGRNDRGGRGNNIIISMPFTTIFILLVLLAATEAKVRITFNRYRRHYATSPLKKLTRGNADEFTFGRFQSPDAIDAAMANCRSSSSFKHHAAKKDGKEGYYCSTPLGGDWVRYWRKANKSPEIAVPPRSSPRTSTGRIKRGGTETR